MLTVVIEELLAASIMVVGTVTIHFFGLMLLLHFLRRGAPRFHTHESIIGQGALVLVMIFGIFAIHTVEIWLYAVAYLSLHASPDFETALYFSTVTFASLGYGDIVLSREWRLFGAIEAANGVILFAWSTAFLLSVMARLRALEHDWRER